MNTYYTWRERVDDILIVPESDPWVHEYPFDYTFATVEDAYQGLEDWGIVDGYWDAEDDEEAPPVGWKPDGWVLVKITEEVVSDDV